MRAYTGPLAAKLAAQSTSLSAFRAPSQFDVGLLGNGTMRYLAPLAMHFRDKTGALLRSPTLVTARLRLPGFPDSLLADYGASGGSRCAARSRSIPWLSAHDHVESELGPVSETSRVYLTPARMEHDGLVTATRVRRQRRPDRRLLRLTPRGISVAETWLQGQGSTVDAVAGSLSRES